MKKTMVLMILLCYVVSFSYAQENSKQDKRNVSFGIYLSYLFQDDKSLFNAVLDGGIKIGVPVFTIGDIDYGTTNRICFWFL